MRQTVQLTKIWGIPIGFNTSWYLIFALVTWSLAVGYMPEAYPELGTLQVWILALITSSLFFASVIFHELAHAFFALRYDIPVRQINLFIFGGVAELEREPTSPWAEFVIAVAGPVASLLAAGFFYLIYLFDQQLPFLAAPTDYLAQINLLLAGFNLIPGFPLDGGRIFRSIVWYFSDYQKATRAAMVSGQLFAYGFMGFGIWQMISDSFYNGLWLVFIGWFLYNAAVAHGRQAAVHHILDEASVGQIMRVDWPEIDGNLPISQLVDEYIIKSQVRYYFVRFTGYGYEADTHPQGMVTVTDIYNLPRSGWGITPASQLMTPWSELVTVGPDLSLTEAVQLMDDHNVNQLPVLQEGELIGVLARENILRYLRMRAETR